jgi:retron-type reverse transcriptase
MINKFYSLDQSPLYRCSTRKRLASTLQISLSALEALADNSQRYNCWEELKKKGGTRRIEAPFDNLKAVQKRISELLLRISPPPYLMAPVKKRSYVHNAAAHVGSKSFHLLDLKDFFPSCTDKKAYWFFNKVLKCPPDVSAILTGIATFNGHLPQGSPCSPIMAYFSYMDMWQQVFDVVKNSGCKLSVYADDITISGQHIAGEDIWRIKRILRTHGHSHSRQKERSLINTAADITGVIVKGSNLLLPNRQHKELARATREMQRPAPEATIQKLERSVRGRRAQATQILGHFSKLALSKTEQ